MGGPPRRGNRPAKQVTVTGGKDRKTVWVLDKNKEPRPVAVKTGLTDGVNTRILEGEIARGTKVIVSATTEGK